MVAKKLCIVCNRRRGKRWCPALNGYVCSYCCGSKRGEQIRCPSNCPYWVRGEGYKATKVEGPKRASQKKESEVLSDILGSILEVRSGFPELTDKEVEEGLNLLIKTYETRQKGLIYEHKSTIPQVMALSHRLGKVLESRMEQSQSYDRVSLEEVISSLKEALASVISHKKAGSSPTAFLDFLYQYEKEEKRKRMELP